MLADTLTALKGAKALAEWVWEGLKAFNKVGKGESIGGLGSDDVNGKYTHGNGQILKEDEDPLNDLDQNPCIEHPHLKKDLREDVDVAGEGALAEVSNPRYVECYKRQG